MWRGGRAQIFTHQSVSGERIEDLTNIFSSPEGGNFWGEREGGNRENKSEGFQ